MLRTIKAKFYRILLGKNKSKYLDYVISHFENDSLLGEIFKSENGIYEENETRLLASVIEQFKDPFLLDIGSNIGLMALNACHFNSKVKVFAIEPGPKQFAHLKQNVEKNRLGNRIQVFNLALSDKNEEIDFCIHEDRHSSGDGILDTGRAGNFSIIKVSSQKLDQWWEQQNHPAINVIKLDAEGAELQILQHAQQLIRATRPVILIEMCDLNFLKYGLTYQDHLEFFHKINYRVFNTNTKSEITSLSDIIQNQFYFVLVPDECHMAIF